MTTATIAVIDANLEKIGHYRDDDYCDMELDATLSCEAVALEIYKDLIEQGALSEPGLELVQGYVTATVKNVAELAEAHGLREPEEEAA